jgi:hypothetical protein
MGEMRTLYRILNIKPERKSLLQDLGVDGKTTLTWTQDGRVWKIILKCRYGGRI